MRVVVRRSSEDFITLKSSWQKLLKDSMVSTPFQTVEFQQEWWHQFGKNNDLLLICVYDGNNLIGLSSMYIDEENVLRWVGGEDIVDYHDVIVNKDNSQVVCTNVFEWLSGSESGNWQTADLVNIPDWSTTTYHFEKLALSKGWNVSKYVHVVCPQLDLPDNFDSYLSNLNGKQRREIRRKLRRANMEDVTTSFVTEDVNIPDAVSDFVDLMESSSKAKSDFLSMEMKDSFISILRTMQKANLLQFCFLRLQDVNLAAYAYFSMNDTLYLYNSGYNTSKYASLSPGWVLLAKLFEYAISTGHKRFDFMRGDEDYKYKFGGIDIPLMRIIIDR